MRVIAALCQMWGAEDRGVWDVAPPLFVIPAEAGMTYVGATAAYPFNVTLIAIRLSPPPGTSNTPGLSRYSPV